MPIGNPGFRSLLALLILFALRSVAGAADWEEFGIPAGGRIRVVGDLSPGQAAVGLYVPAGTAARPESPLLARLAPLAFIGATGLEPGTDLAADLAARGWTLRNRCDLDGAGLVLAGPRAGLEPVLARLLERLARPGDIDQADLDAAWRALESDWRRWEPQAEVGLRQELAVLHHGAHPFRAGLAQRRPADAAPPSLASLGEFVAEYYQAGTMVCLVAGDLRTDALLAGWRQRFEALPGHLLPPPASASPGRGGGELRLPTEQASLLLLQYPAPGAGSEDRAAAAALAGVITQRLRLDVLERGLARGASAWFDFTSPGPTPLEIQVRGFDAERVEPLRALLERIVDRMRKGEFSEYQVISAKDIILNRIDAAAPGSAGPRDDSLFALAIWCEQVLRQALYFDRSRLVFENRLLDTGKPEVSAMARRILQPEQASLGLLIPEAQLE